MNHLMLKFNHGVEIGARLAYLGHFKRTGEAGIYTIIQEESHHRETLETILKQHGESSSKIIDGSFRIVGNTIGWLCKFMPLWSLDYVARTMETFAIFNYGYLAVRYPMYRSYFIEMGEAEERHEEYFRLGPVQYQNLQNLRNSLVGGRQ